MSLATAGKFGIGFTPNDRNVYNRSGVTVSVGDVLAFDTRGTQSSDAVYGSETSAYSNMVTNSNTAEHLRGGFAGIVTGLRGGGGLDGSKVTVRVTGKVAAALVTEDSGTGGDVIQGDLLYFNTADNELHTNTATLAASRKVLAIYDDLAVLTQGTSGLREVTLDGIHGFGST